jgi:hypothetical protein
MQEIKDYEINELTSTIIGIYKDYITGYFNKIDNLITIDDKVPNKSDIQLKINKIFKDLDIVNEVKDHLWDIIYNGAWCFKIAFDKESRKYIKLHLCNPHNVVTIKKDKDNYCHLVVSRDGTIFQVKPDSIFRIGSTDLTLVNDINKDFFGKKKEDTLVTSDYMVAGTPLYYNISGKVKEYLLKEQILTLLSIKDLVQPLLLLVRLDKNTAPDEGNKLALNIENMINKYSDISSILSSNFSINSLIDSLMNNIRVIPDYQSTMGDMNNVDLSKITNKIQDIEQNQENKKEAILTANSIPRSLYNGESTKWDAIKSSQRLNSKINGIVVNISKSLRDEAVSIIRSDMNIDIEPEKVKINLFTKTDVDYNVELTNTEIVSQLNDGIQRILQGCNQSIQDTRFIDSEKYIKYIARQLKLIDPSISEFINEATITKYIQDMQAAAQQQQQQQGMQ